MFVAQLIGIIAMLIGWYANSLSDDRRLLTTNAIAALLTACHLGLMGSTIGMTNQLVNGARFALGRKRGTILVPIGFSLFAIIQGILLATHWTEWMLVSASVLSSYLLFATKGKTLRIGLITCSLLSLTFATNLQSISGILFHLVNISVLCRTLYHMRQQGELAHS